VDFFASSRISSVNCETLRSDVMWTVKESELNKIERYRDKKMEDQRKDEIKWNKLLFEI
jgi:DNA-binding transcriptional regulator YdaS (Cro superfamily)